MHVFVVASAAPTAAPAAPAADAFSCVGRGCLRAAAAGVFVLHLAPSAHLRAAAAGVSCCGCCGCGCLWAAAVFVLHFAPQKVQFREGPPSLRAHDAMVQQAKGWKSDV